MAIITVSFGNGFVGDYSKNNEAINANYLTTYGWSNFQFRQSTDNGQFGGSQGNDYSGTILITDSNGVQHAIDGVINWRAPSGTVSTIVFYATGASQTLATNSGTYLIDPFSGANGDPRTFIGLTFNGQTLNISGGQVNGNAATSGLLSSLNTYLGAQPQLTVGDVVVDEGAGIATVTVTMSKVSSDTVTVKYASADGSASAGSDYTGVNGTLTFNPGETSKTIQISILNDTALESAENFGITLSDSRFAAITDNSATVQITDNDAVAVTVSSVLAEDAANTGATPTDSTVTEGASLRYTVGLSAAGGSATEFSLAIGGSSGAGDYGAFSFSNGVAWKNGNPATGVIVVPAGVASFTITVPTSDDALIENTESLTLTVGGVAATGSIIDNDSQSVSGVLAEDAANTGANPVDSSVVEGGSLAYTVVLSAVGIAASEYSLAVGGTAAAADYVSFSFSDGVAWKNGDPLTGIIVVPAGVGSFRITVATADDAAIESAESLTLTVGGVAATGTITDNDSQSVSSVLAEDAANTGANPVDSSVVEGGSLAYTVALSAVGIAASEYSLAIGGTAAVADYGSISFSDGVAWKNGDPLSGIIVVPAGVGSFRITVATTDDAAIESAESLTLTLTVGGVAASGTITDNDSQSVSSVLAEDAANAGANPVDSSVVEGGSLRYAVTLNAAGVSATEYTLSLGGTASAADYAGISFSDGVAWKNGNPASGIIVVPAGVASFGITVVTSDDALIESTESLSLTVGGVAATGTITDNDSQSVSGVVAEDAANTGGNPVDSSVIEGGSLRYTVALNAAAPSATEYTLGIGGTASAADYSNISFSDGVAWKNGNPASGIIVVPAGVGGFAITVTTADDAAIEVAESLTLTVGGVAATGTITDNDSLSVSSVVAEDAAHVGAIPVDDSVVEGASLLYSVVLNGSSAQAVEFSLAVSGTAAAADYGSFSFSNGVAWKNGDPLSGVIVVPANVGSFTITVPSTDDSQIEVAESLVLNVGGLSASGTLTDNDSQNVASVLAEDAANTGANPPDNSVVEGASLRYSVALTQASPVATEYAVSVSGTAAAADYGSFSFSNGVGWKNGSPASGILVVPANVLSFTVTVPTVDDSAIELAESLTLAVGGVDASATITDNDSQSVSSVTVQDAGHLGANDNTVEEGGALLYTVLLNSASPAATTHTVSVHGTAAATADYGSFSFSNGVAWQGGNPSSGILVVPANVSGFTITVPTVDDSVVESAESLILTVGGVSAAGAIEDNDQVPTTPPKPPTGPIDAGLDPTSDNGSSSNDTVTSVITPEFTVRAEGYLQQGGSIRLVDPSGKQVGSNAISAADASAGTINVQTGQLDDGVYTFRAEIYDASGKLLGSAPVKVTVVTDVDGIAPSVELAANGGDFNRDGIADWQQHNVAQLPLASLAEFEAGRAAAASSFGAILAGSVGAANAAGAVQLTGNAQLADLSMSAAPAPLPTNTQAASAMFNFSVRARPDSGPLPDLDSSRPGLQTRVVLDLAPGGVQANAYLKWNAQSQSWFNFVDDQRLDTFDDGATLLDLNGDGKADRVVLTLTDGGAGDEDGVANGVIVDPGMLAFQSAPKPPEPPAAKPVFAVLLANGDRYYSADAAEAARMAQGESARLEGAYFDSLSIEAGGRAMLPSFQPFTSDWYFAAAGQSLPYACYIAQPGAGFLAAAAGAAGLTDFHLYQNQLGQTQLLSAAQAASLGLAAQGYGDRGAQFSSGTASAFAFDAEGYLVANRENAGIVALVGSLAQRFSSSSAAGFIEAVEQHYLGQVQLVGLPHGGAAGAAELNAAFGTHFNA